MNDFLHHAFLQAPGSGTSDFITDYLVNTIVILTACGLAIYVIALFLLVLPSVYRSDTAVSKVDTDIRVKLCLSWAILVNLLLLGAGVFWIRWSALISRDNGFISDLRSLACYATALVIIAAIWIIFHFSIRNDLKNASRTLA